MHLKKRTNRKLCLCVQTVDKALLLQGFAILLEPLF